MPRSPHLASDLIHSVTDDFGISVADFNFFPNERTLYVRWHGHLTSKEVVRVAQASLPWVEQLHPLGMINDKRGTSGDWGEALTWLEFEWTPVVKANGLRSFAYVLDPDTPVSPGNAQTLEHLEQELELRTFYTVGPAWRWMRQRTQRLLSVA
ncbi:hypothetical protein [Hymenobacter sp. B81]|uniref:hypothetical protein n=1 Tax=Hymenobacter sp. B81 TaxID=3344878 RepID=UPI0037DD6572